MSEKADNGGWHLLLFPDAASDMAGKVDALFWALTVSSALVVLGIATIIVVYCIRYRAGSPRERRPASGKGAQLIEIAWTIPVFLAFAVFFVWSAALYLELYREPAAGDQKINVVAKQWMWKFQHPEGAREINELHVPVGTRINLRFISQDVIHSFYVPAFRTKLDVLPGRYTHASFTATRPGEYHLFCAEYCGLDHSKMTGKVIAMPPARYQAWLQRQPVARSPAEAGEALFRQHGCSGCHQGDSAVRAPPLAGLYGKPVPLAGGETVTADERYLRGAILQPNREIAAGYEPLMPSFQGRISEGEVLQIVAYIKSLADEEPEQP